MTASRSFAALGGNAMVAVSEPSSLDAALHAVRAEIAALDQACSRFRADSQLSLLNAAAGEEVRVGSFLLEAIGVALHAAQVTDGAVDPTVGATLLALGYDRDFDAIAPGGPVSLVPVPGWRSVEVDSDRSTVRLPVGVKLDLGATAKALGADRAAARAYESVGCGVLVGLSGDLAFAGPAPDGGWPVRMTDDHRSGIRAPGQWISVSDGGVATSSTVGRRWRTAEGHVHHLVDPRSGWPAQGPWRTVSVAASSCLGANIASTASIVYGETAVGWLEAQAMPARLVSLDGVARHVAGWPPAGDDLAPVGSSAPAGPEAVIA